MGGLALGSALSAVNLAGAFLTVYALGGLGPWSAVQFVGLFGLVEAGTGLGFILGPNVWRLPMAAVACGERDLRLTAGELLRPHWAGSVKCAAGVLFLAYAMAKEGAGAGSALLLPTGLLMTAGGMGLSLLAARFGADHPEMDVVEVALRRPGRAERVVPAMSISATAVQVILNLGAFPLVKVLPPSMLYRPETEPSPAFLGWTALVCLGLMAAGIGAWWGRWAVRLPQRGSVLAGKDGRVRREAEPGAQRGR